MQDFRAITRVGMEAGGDIGFVGGGRLAQKQLGLADLPHELF